MKNTEKGAARHGHALQGAISEAISTRKLRNGAGGYVYTEVGHHVETREYGVAKRCDKVAALAILQDGPAGGVVYHIATRGHELDAEVDKGVAVVRYVDSLSELIASADGARTDRCAPTVDRLRVCSRPHKEQPAGHHERENHVLTDHEITPLQGRRL